MANTKESPALAEQGNNGKESISNNSTVSEEKQQKRKLSERLRSFADIVDAEDVETKYVIEKLLPENFILLLSGRRGTKKSLIALRMAIDIAIRSPFLSEEWKTTQSEVIYVDLENSIKLIKKRLNLLSRYYAHDLKFLLRQDIMTLNIETQLEEMKELVKNKVVFIDTLSKLHRKDENSNTQMTTIMEHLINLAQTEAKALIVVHHKGKAVDLGSRGATAIEDNADVVIEIHSNGNHINFKCTKHRDGREDDFTKLLEITFSDAEIKIEDATQKELNIFFECLIKLHKEDSSIFSTQTKLIDAIQKHGYSKDTIITLLNDCIEYGLIGKRKGENNSTAYYFK